MNQPPNKEKCEHCRIGCIHYHAKDPSTPKEERKYNSVWQVLNCRNDLKDKYKVIESLFVL